MKKFALLFALFLFIFSCGGSSQLQHKNITQENLSGKLSKDQLSKIAVAIGEIEKLPLDNKSDEVRSVLVKWLIGSPDVTITVYSVLGKKEQLDKKVSSLLTIQMMLSTAAVIIENESLAKDEVKSTTEGLKRTLGVYKILKANSSQKVFDDYLEYLIGEQDENKLEDYVKEIIDKSKNK